MLNDVIALTLIVIGSAVALTILNGREERWLRVAGWAAFVEYGASAVVQYISGADANGYRATGYELMRFLDQHFAWAAWQNFLLFVQQPNAFDGAVIGAGSNTGSMAAAAAFVLFIVRGSAYGAQALMAAGSLFSSLAIFRAFRRAAPNTSPRRLFAATVLFPSIAYWTSALHKEAFCLLGLGFVFAAWNAVADRKLRAVFYGALGLLIVTMTRAPALPPILGGLVLFAVLRRIQRMRGPEQTIVGPVYLVLGFVALAGGMLLVAQFSPDLAIDKIGESVAVHQRAWKAAEGGSNFDVEREVDESTGAQLASAPLALVNALFRPQLFDVNNASMFVSAVEMTVMTVLLVLALRMHGVRGLVKRVTSSPFLLMCLATTLVGCTFVGLTTRNFGSLARYRVPFLPFYGALLGVLTERLVAPSPKTSATPAAVVRGRASRTRRAATT